MTGLSLQALAWEQDKIRRKETMWQWLLTWPQEAVDELREWLDAKEAGVFEAQIQEVIRRGH